MGNIINSMISEYTEEQALKDCIALWSVLAESGGSDKLEVIESIGLPPFKNLCPCCEHAHGHWFNMWFNMRAICADHMCNYCLLLDVWGKGELLFRESAICEAYSDSPWRLWDMSCDAENRKVYAQQIVDGAKGKLAKLKGES